jgi:multidrug efflux pump subunit AcrA (membrane-fusion protein)
MKRTNLFIFIALFLLIFLSGCSKKETKQNSTFKDELIIPVLVKKAYRGELDIFLETDAKVKYDKISNLSFQVSGKIKEIFVKEGQVVKKGQLLAKLDEETYNYQLQDSYQRVLAAKANYEQAVYNFKIQKINALSDLNKAQLALKQAKENLYLAETLLSQSKRDFERYSELYREGVISSQQYENVKISYQNSLTNYYNAKINLETQKENLSVAKLKNERVSIFENQMKAAYFSYISALKNYEIIKENFQYTSLYSPYDGIILDKYKDVGEVVNPSVPVFAIGFTNSKSVEATISDLDAKNIKPNSKAVVVFKDQQFPVVIEKVFPSVNSVGFSIVKAKFKQPNNLNHNDYVNLKIAKNTLRGLIILRQAIVYEESGPKVFAVENNKAIKKSIKIIDSYGDYAVIEGIEEGEQVIIDGQYFVKDGDQVKVVEKK